MGRIVAESEGSLTANTLMLESSRSIGSGVRVPLDCSAVSNYALFPGQVKVSLKSPYSNSI